MGIGLHSRLVTTGARRTPPATAARRPEPPLVVSRTSPTRTTPPPAGVDADGVPLALRAAAGWTWRILVVALGIVALLRLLSQFRVLVVPVLVALLVVALIKPAVDGLTARPGRAGLPRSAASLVGILLALAFIAALIGLIGQQVATGFEDLRRQSVEGLDQVRTQLQNSPAHLSGDRIGTALDDLRTNLSGNRERLVSGAMRVGSTAADIGTGFFIVLFASFFFLSGGDRIWAWIVGLFPASARRRVDGAGLRAWATLTAYVRATVIVAVVDGVGVGVVAAVLRVPLAIPLGVLVFLGAFVPVMGALVTGAVAVLVALVAAGPVVAGLMLLGVIAVQQLEAHVLQPFLMGHAVRVHPLAVVLVITAGVLLAGVVGGLFAVPVAAVVNVVAQYLREPEPEAEHEAEDAGPLADLPDETPAATSVDSARAGTGPGPDRCGHPQEG